MNTRLKRTLGVLLVRLTALLVYGVGFEPRLILAVDREPATLPHLPPSWDGQHVAVISDFHVGMWLDHRAMAPAVQQIVTGHPAAVFLLSDFINQASGNVSGEIQTITGSWQRMAVTVASLSGQHTASLSVGELPVTEPGAM